MNFLARWAWILCLSSIFLLTLSKCFGVRKHRSRVKGKPKLSEVVGDLAVSSRKIELYSVGNWESSHRSFVAEWKMLKRCEKRYLEKALLSHLHATGSSSWAPFTLFWSSPFQAPRLKGKWIESRCAKTAQGLGRDSSGACKYCFQCLIPLCQLVVYPMINKWDSLL